MSLQLSTSKQPPVLNAFYAFNGDLRKNIVLTDNILKNMAWSIINNEEGTSGIMNKIEKIMYARIAIITTVTELRAQPQNARLYVHIYAHAAQLHEQVARLQPIVAQLHTYISSLCPFHFRPNNNHRNFAKLYMNVAQLNIHAARLYVYAAHASMYDLSRPSARPSHVTPLLTPHISEGPAQSLRTGAKRTRNPEAEAENRPSKIARPLSPFSLPEVPSSYHVVEEEPIEQEENDCFI
jgi:hypothetical protein